MKYINLSRFISLFLFVSAPAVAFSQLAVSTTMTPQQLVQNVLVGSGVTVSNITYTGIAGSIGKFTTGTTPTNLGLSSGLILSTGLVDGSLLQPLVGSPVTNFCSYSTMAGSDPDLANLIPGFTVNDATVLQFDFIPLADTIKFRYVFGSEEYPEFVGTTFNDVFGFFVNGANPAGGTYTNKNIALIPGTSTPVTIDNVNSGSNPAFYVDNQALNGQTIVYDGFTTVLTAWCLVVPCSTYHIKIAIGDAGDTAYDSAVFLEENSFTSNAITLSYTTSMNIDTSAIEGCSDLIIGFKIPAAKTVPTTVNYILGGTAVNGVDYYLQGTTGPIPNSWVIPPYTDSVVMTITPVMDGIVEGTETIIFNVQNTPCSSNLYTYYIKDYNPLSLVMSNDTTICGGSAFINGNLTGGIAPYNYTWDNGLGNTNSAFVNPVVSTTYTLIGNDGCGGSDTNHVTVNIGSGYAYAGPDTSICAGGTATLSASTGSTFLWSNGSTTQTISVSPVTTTTYVVTVIDGCSAQDTVVVNINPIPTITTNANPSIICIGTPTIITASGGSTYVWASSPYDATLAGQQNNATATVSPLVTTSYLVTVSDNNTCTNTANLLVTVNPLPTSDFTLPSGACANQNVSVTYNGSATPGASYNWNFGGGQIISGAGMGPYTLAFNSNGAFTVTLEVTENGCLGPLTTHTIQVDPVPVPDFIGNPLESCAPLETNFTNTSTGVSAATIYQWTFGDGGSSTATNPSHTYNNPGYYSVMLVASNGACSATAVKNQYLHVFNYPDAEIEIYPPVVTIFDPLVSIGYSPLSTISAVSWYISDGTQTTENSFEHVFADTGTYQVVLVMTNEFGCVDSVNTTIRVRPDYTIYVPNAFTPDDDGLNDVFQVYSTGLKTFEMVIYNRWGQQLFFTKDVNEGWDGKVNGSLAPEGVYVYRIIYMDALYKIHTIDGNIAIIK